VLSKWKGDCIAILDDLGAFTNCQYVVPEFWVIIIDSDPLWQSGELREYWFRWYKTFTFRPII